MVTSKVRIVENSQHKGASSAFRKWGDSQSPNPPYIETNIKTMDSLDLYGDYGPFQFAFERVLYRPIGRKQQTDRFLSIISSLMIIFVNSDK